MNLLDIMDVYALEHDSNDLYYMLKDYVLDERVDRDILNLEILRSLGAMRPITTDPDLYKLLLDGFFSRYNSNISRLADTLELEYNPLHNKDMLEEEHRHSVGDIDNSDEYDTSTDGTSSTDVSAYDSSSYQPKDRNTVDNDVHHSAKTTSDIDSTVDTAKTTRGKDGDMTYQEMIEKERKLVEFNIYNWIISRMRRELFILLY